MMMVRNVLLAFGVAAALSAGPAMAAGQAEVRRAVQDFMVGYTDKLLSRYGKGSRVEYSVAVDSRLALAGCAAPLKLEPKEQGPWSSRLNVQVSCPAGNTWSIYVPVDLSIYRPVVMATRPLIRGETLSAADLKMGEAEIGRVNGQFLASIDAAIGMDVKRPITAGAIVQPQQLEPPLMIKRGQAVMVVAETGVIAVKMPGVALSDGRRGEQIRIKNNSTARIVQAQVVAPGQAVVPM